MSYSDSVKKELAGEPVKNTCCRRALAAGIIYGAEESAAGFSVTSGSGEVTALVGKLIAERFHTELSTKKFNRNGEEKETLTFSSKPAAALAASGDVEGEIKCQGCEAAFLRGVFIASATLSDPRSSSYHAEFVLPDAPRARAVYGLLARLGHAPKIINRKYGTGLYFKDSEKIEELLVLLGANSAAFGLMNCKIERTIRNDENRATNCVAQNIAKTVSASRRQVEDILKLMANGRLDSMPYDVRVTAKLRVENPEVSLSELAALHKPKISKSGLNHRLEKIAAEAEKD
jgi:DNA-binding protein WhiA